MSVYWFVAILFGMYIAFLWLMTILLRRLLSKKGVGTFTCFVVVLGAVSILQIVNALRH
jgi:uncharacterized membrane protein YhiD involved in acid resistance